MLRRYETTENGLGATNVLASGLQELSTKKDIPAEEKEAHDNNIKTLRTTLASTYVVWSDTYDDDSLVALTEKLIRLEPALQLAPDSPAVLARIAQISTLEGRPALVATTRLKRILASSKAPAIVHFILGTSAAERNDVETAVFHLEQATRSNPNVPVTLNNLAWVISHEKGAQDDPEKLSRANRLIEKALSFKPGNPQFRETHGQILLMQGKWKDAITELEFALRRMKGEQVPIHQSLATAYEKLGDTELAEMHRGLMTAVAQGDRDDSKLAPGELPKPQAPVKSKDTQVTNADPAPSQPVAVPRQPRDTKAPPELVKKGPAGQSNGRPSAGADSKPVTSDGPRQQTGIIPPKKEVPLPPAETKEAVEELPPPGTTGSGDQR